MIRNATQLPKQGSFFDIGSQLDEKHPLIALAEKIDWGCIEKELSQFYSTEKGRPGKPIRLMSGLLMLKQLYDYSDEMLVSQWVMNPYFQRFCGAIGFQTQLPCDSSELSKFRSRIGSVGVEVIFAQSLKLHGNAVEEKIVLVDTTVQEKAITYPTDSKLAIKIINRLNKLAKHNGVKQRRTYIKEVKELRLNCRHFRHVKKRAKAKKALKRLRTIAGALMRELARKLPEATEVEQQENFKLYQKVLSQSPKDKNKIYSLHATDVYCIGKGKDHVAYEYGKKASIVMTQKSQLIIGVESHDEHMHDSKTLKPALDAAHRNRHKKIKMAVVDRGYRGAQKYVAEEGIEVLLPKPPLKKDNAYQRDKKRKLCRNRAAIEPVIGHLKHSFRLNEKLA